MVVPAECSFCPPCNQTLAWPLLTKRFSPTLREQWRLIWKLDSRVAVQNHQAWAYVRYWIGPLKALTFSSAKPTTDFTFAATLGTIMHLLSPPFFSYLSLSLALSLCFPHLLYCVSVRSTASACFESFSFHRNACVWEACSFGERLRCHLWYFAEND